MIELGAAFANFSIRTPTEDAERTLRRWMDAGRPLDLRGITEQLRATRERRMLSVAALSRLQIMTLCGLHSPLAEAAFMQLTWGYGPAKASFAMALSGIGTMACIDRRMISKYHIQPDRLDKMTSYIAVVDELYPDSQDSASACAIEWLHDLARQRYETQHELMLGVPWPQMAFSFGD